MGGKRRALLMGSQTGGLEGVEGDVERMAGALAPWDFALTKCRAADATRAGIMAACEQLIDESGADDAICLYYSGRGGSAPNPYQTGPRSLQYLVPTDHGPSAFRGVMAFELSALLARLTAKTRNVTVIFDCCYVADMSRDPSLLQVGALTLKPKVFEGDVSEAQVKALLDETAAREALGDVESNPHVLRLVATEAHRSAFEGKLQHASSGIFSNALIQALAVRSERPSSWGSVMLEVREQVMALKQEQRPDADGPRRRELWRVAQVPDHRPLALFFDGRAARLRGGALLGAVPGARFGVMPAGSEKYAAAEALAEARVVESFGSTSRVELEASQHVQLPPAGLLAFPLSGPERKCQVALGPELSPELGGFCAGSRYLTPVDLEPGAAVPSVTRHAAELVVRDRSGLVLLRAPQADAAAAVERLEFLACAEALRALAPGRLSATLSVELGRVVQRKCVKMASSEVWCVGDLQYISVTNCGDAAVFVAVLGIDAKYSVRLLSRGAARGQMLRPHQSLCLGQNAEGDWQGVEVSWPERLPADGLRRESVIVIAADEQQDFSLLTTGDVYDLKLVYQQRTTPDSVPVRPARGAAPIGSEYTLQCLDYQLSPKPRPR